MTRLIKKSKCNFEQGYIIKKNEIIGIPHIIYWQLSKLELMIQQYDHLSKAEPFNPGPTLNDFEFKSALDVELPKIKAPDTPITDKRVSEAMEFMNEVDACERANNANALIEKFKELINWCDSEKFIEGDCCKQLDLYNIGNPLELTSQEIAAILSTISMNPIIMEK